MATKNSKTIGDQAHFWVEEIMRIRYFSLVFLKICLIKF